MKNAQPLWPNYTEEEIEAVTRVLRSNKVNYWTGDEGRKFESEFAHFAQTNHAVALANGTVALDLALHGLRIGSNNGGQASDEVIVTPRSFIASASSVVNAGARPVFADVDPDSQNITPSTAERHITDQTRAIICVHLAGWPCDMDGFNTLTAERGINLIEDCAQAHGARYKGRPVGGLGDVAAWSFCQDKIMSTGGEGGMVTCNDEDLWKRMWSFKDHGKNWNSVYERQHKPGFRWLHDSFGTNWRLTEMQSAIGRIQLKRMPEWRRKRAENARKIRESLKSLSELVDYLKFPWLECDHVECQTPDLKCQHAFYKYYVFVRRDILGIENSRDDIIQDLTEIGYQCMQGSCSEIYLEKAFAETVFRPDTSLPIAKQLGETSIMFNVHPGIES
ncbi:MAG: DegT/DnrJ/EryC1/StrS aminotransferase family protein [Roseibium sp.]